MGHPGGQGLLRNLLLVHQNRSSRKNGPQPFGRGTRLYWRGFSYPSTWPLGINDRWMDNLGGVFKAFCVAGFLVIWELITWNLCAARIGPTVRSILTNPMVSMLWPLKLDTLIIYLVILSQSMPTASKTNNEMMLSKDLCSRMALLRSTVFMLVVT